MAGSCVFGEPKVMRVRMIAGSVLAATLSMPAQAWVVAHVETSPANQALFAAGALVESFATATTGSFRSTFGGSNLGATFTGFTLSGPTATGSAFGASAYATTSGTANIKLDRMAKYLSFRAAALDGSDTMELFQAGKSLGFYNLVESAAGAGFGGDPASTAGAYTFVNFFTDQGFDEIRFTQSRGSFALDDFGVGQVTAVPEVKTWAMLVFGFGVLGVALRRRFKRVKFA
jgi:hypothetical protein